MGTYHRRHPDGNYQVANKVQALDPFGAEHLTNSLEHLAELTAEPLGWAVAVNSSGPGCG
jgi:hypothetical protein